MRARSLAILPALALAAACATAPDAETPAVGLDVPERWTTAPAAETLDAGWWSSFGDERLERLIETALEHNQDLRAAAAAVDSAAALARIAGADLQPQLSFDLDASRRQQVFVGLPIPGREGVLSSKSDSFGAGIAVSWEADLWGRLRAGRDAAAREALAAEADWAAARLSLSAQTARAWFALLEAENQVALAEATAESRQRTTRRIGTRFQRGVAPPLDLRLARTNQAQAESILAQRRRQLDAVRRQLDVLLGRYPAGEIEAAGEIESAVELPPPPAAVPAALPAELVRRRPDLYARELRLEAAGLRVAEARAALYPRLSLTGSGGTASDDLGDLLESDFTVWNLAGGLLQPIFQGGRLRSAVDRSLAERDRVLAAYVQSLLNAFSEVETALAAEGLLREEEEALETAAEESRAAVELARDRYLRGVGGYLSVLESERQAFGSESQLLSVRRLLLENRVDLYLALGGGFEERK